jgi:spermidine synthase
VVREAAALIAAAALVAWFFVPSDLIVTRALGTPEAGERVVANTEGLTELVTITEAPDHVRTLVTNGHPMSATTWMGQRYMRALAHIPLLCMDDPKAVLVIGFGVGNTTHAATLHSSIRSIEVADLSRNILAHAGDFRDVNHDVLSDPRVTVFVNDGRHHLRMRAAGAYDLITLEPPPIAYAGVAALYSTEFYQLASSRLRSDGYLSQWLPAYQVPASTTLAMIRSFVDVFPQSVLLSGAAGELLLVGTNGPKIEADPERVMRALARLPGVAADLQRLDLGTPRAIVGTFVGSPGRLAAATRDAPAVTDDHPVQEYGVRSLIRDGDALPASVVDLAGVREWCPTCFIGEMPAPAVTGLDVYLALLERAYEGKPASSVSTAAPSRAVTPGLAELFGDARYLAEVVPDSAEVHNMIGIALAQRDRIDQAIDEFRAALQLEPDVPQTHWHLGAALASTGARDEAVVHLRRAVELDPQNEDARRDLEAVVASGKVESGKVEK